MAQLSQFPSFLQSNTSDAFLEWIRSNLNVSFPLNRITKDFAPGEAIHFGQAAKISTDGNIYKCSDVSSSGYIGIVESWDSNAIFRVVVNGYCHVVNSGWTAGQIYYIGSDGYLSSIGTGKKVAVGIATDAIIVLPEGSGGSGGGVTSIATSSPITGGPITTSGTIGIIQANGSTDGYISAVDWNIFNNKQDVATAIHTTGDETKAGILTLTSIPVAPGYSTPSGTDQDVLLANGTTTTISDVANGGQTEVFYWRFDTSTTGTDPGTGKFRFDFTTVASITNIYIDDITFFAGIDVSALFGQIDGNWLIHIQETNNATNFVQFTTSVPYIDNTGWWTIPVTFVQSGGLPFSMNNRCAFVFINQNSGTSGGVTSVSGTTNRITSTGGTTPVIDVSNVLLNEINEMAIAYAVAL